MNNFIGNIYNGLGRLIEVILEFFISILEIIVNILNTGKRMLGGLFALLMLMLFSPLFFLLIFSSGLGRFIWILVLLFFIMPILGRGLINFLRYGQYIITEFFYDRAEFYHSDKTKEYKNFKDYSNQYKAQQEEQRRREYERQRRAQEKMWEEAFRDFYGRSGHYDSRYGRRTNSGGYQGNIYNPTQDFIKEYENACKVLGLEPTTDKYEIKLAYRKKAKEYHPDVNKSENATETFQKINEANSFLSDENIERYKNIKKNTAS